MSILDYVRAAVGPAAEARAGWKAGDETRRERTRVEQLQNAALERQTRMDEQGAQRQSILDQIKAQLDASTMERNQTQSDLNRRRPAATNAPQDPLVRVRQADGGTKLVKRSEAAGMVEPPAPITAPHTVASDQGIKQWDPKTQTWKDTKLTRTPRPAASESPRASLRDQLMGIERQVDNTRQDLARAERVSVADDPRKDPAVIALQQRLDSLTVVSDGMNLKLQRDDGRPSTPSRGVPPGALPNARPASAGDSTGLKPSPAMSTGVASKEEYTREFAEAAQKYQTLLMRGYNKVKAKELYDEEVKRIAAKYGMTAPAPQREEQEENDDDDASEYDEEQDY